MTTTLQPTLQTTRDYFLDVWRGFAITGVLFAYIIWNLGNLPEQQWTAADKIIGKWTEILVDGKFYTPLSLLFGMGFYVQFQKSRQNQNSVVPFALRRIYKMKPFANMGRMALTNYLSQSMIMIPACFIFGLFDHFTPLKTVAWSAGIWIAQAVFSTWWLKRYNFGPFEWLLRSFTYWKWQPMRKKGNIRTTEQPYNVQNKIFTP